MTGLQNQGTVLKKKLKSRVEKKKVVAGKQNEAMLPNMELHL
jgi:hypothetical protein